MRVMMEESNSLLLNEEALRLCPDPSKPVFVYEWLRYLHRILPATRRADLKSCQQRLVEQLVGKIGYVGGVAVGVPTRHLLAKCLAQVFVISASYDHVFATVNACNDVLRVREESGQQQLQVKLTALAVLAQMYERLGRMVGRGFEESVQLMSKWLKQAEWGSRVEILHTLTKLVRGLAAAANPTHRELYKLLTKSCLTDRVMAVRTAAAACLAELVRVPSSPIYAYYDVESICTVCVKAIDSASNYEVRGEVARVFAALASYVARNSPDEASIRSTSTATGRGGKAPQTTSTTTINSSQGQLGGGGASTSTSPPSSTTTTSAPSLSSAPAALSSIASPGAMGQSTSNSTHLQQQTAGSSATANRNRTVTLRDLLNHLAQAFCRGGVGGVFAAMKSRSAAGGKALIAGGAAATTAVANYSSASPAAHPSHAPSTRYKETRIGLAHAYVAVAREMGAAWLERNLHEWISHLMMEVLARCAGPLAATTDAGQLAELLVVRRCVLHVFRGTLGEMLSEQAQIAACRQLGEMVAECIGHFDCASDHSSHHQSSQQQTPRDSNLAPLEQQPPPPAVLLTPGVYTNAQTSLVALLELSALVSQVGTPAQPLFTEASGILEPIFASLLHPLRIARTAAAWCLRCVATAAVPSLLTPLIDRCLSRLEHMRCSPEALSGFSLALASLLAGSRAQLELGVPNAKARQVFATGEELIKGAVATPNLAQQKVAAGWLLISAAHATLTRPTPFWRENLHRLCALWRSTFPRSVEEAQAEGQRGDIYTWESTLEARAGAFLAMLSLMLHCPELLVDEQLVEKELRPIVETTLTTLALVADALVPQHGSRLRTPLYTLRLRLYSLLFLLPAKSLDALLNPLLRELVADITVTDNAQAFHCSSLLSDESMCTALAQPLLGGWLLNSHGAYLELDAHPHRTGVASGSIENDSYSTLVLASDGWLEAADQRGGVGAQQVHGWPEPLPVAIASLDAAILLFGRLFPTVNGKRRLQLAQHFLTCTANAKPAASAHLSSKLSAMRHTGIQLNVLGALCAAMRAMGEAGRGGSGGSPSHRSIEGEELQQACVGIILPHLNSQHQLLKCLAIETLGRLAQAVGQPQFVAGIAQYCFDKLRQIRDERARTGYVLSLGSLHRYMGSLGSGQHLNTSVSIILALAQDSSSQMVQSWSILSLSLIATTGGGMFRGYVEPSLSLCLRLLLSTPATHVEVILAVARLISALITSVGAELPMVSGSGAGIEHTRTSFLIACSMMMENRNASIRAEAIYCFQQLHLFAPRFVQMDKLVADICESIYSSDLQLCKAAVSCLRQLLLRESKEVRAYTRQLQCSHHRQNTRGATSTIGAAAASMGAQPSQAEKQVAGHTLVLSSSSPLPESGLEGALFELLDSEAASADGELCENAKECLLSLAQATCTDSLGAWLELCKQVLAAGGIVTTTAAAIETAATSAITRSTMWVGDDGAEMPPPPPPLRLGVDYPAAPTTTTGRVMEGGVQEEEHDDDDNILHGANSTSSSTTSQQGNRHLRRHHRLSPRWQTRVFAVEVGGRVMATCGGERAHTDLALAKELQMARVAGSGGGGGGGNHWGDYLVLHLADLVRMAFMAATSECVPLRLAGLRMLQKVVEHFAATPEPDYPGHLLLEQFQAQVGAALRPAFAPEAPSHVTAAACQVCSAWLRTGVAQDANDLRRVLQPLISVLAKLKHGSINTQLYNERAATREKLVILKAWAEVYRVAVSAAAVATPVTTNTTERKQDNVAPRPRLLLGIIQPELSTLVSHWLAVLRDTVLLSLAPPPSSSSFPPQHRHGEPRRPSNSGSNSWEEHSCPAFLDTGTFFNRESADSCRDCYRDCWPPILLSTALALTRAERLDEGDTAGEVTRANEEGDGGLAHAAHHPSHTATTISSDSALAEMDDSGSAASGLAALDAPEHQRQPRWWAKEKQFSLVLGLAVQQSIIATSVGNSRRGWWGGEGEEEKCLHTCLEAITTLLQVEWGQLALMQGKAGEEARLGVELLSVLQRLIAAKDSLPLQHRCGEVAMEILRAAQNSASHAPKGQKSVGAHGNHYYSGNESTFRPTNVSHSPVVALLEVAFALLRKQLPGVSPRRGRVPGGEQTGIIQSRSHSSRPLSSPPESVEKLVQLAVQLLAEIPSLCSTEGRATVLPTVLYLLLATLRESVTLRPDSQGAGGEIASAAESQPSRGQVSGIAAAVILALRSVSSFSSASTAADELQQAGGGRKESSSLLPTLRSALLSLLNMLQQNGEEGQASDDGPPSAAQQEQPRKVVADPAMVVVAATVMVASAPPEMVLECPKLFEKLCGVLKRHLLLLPQHPHLPSPVEASHLQQRQHICLKALQSVNSLLAIRELHSAFAAELGPAICATLGPYVTATGQRQKEASEEPSELELPPLEAISDTELLIIQEAVKAFESKFFAFAAEGERGAQNLLQLLVRCLTRFLCAEPSTTLSSLPENVNKLHDFSLRHLNAIGLEHPIAFKTVLQTHTPQIRERIAEAARHQKEQQEQQQKERLLMEERRKMAGGGWKTQPSPLGQAPAQPTIKLADDFSAFAIAGTAKKQSEEKNTEE